MDRKYVKVWTVLLNITLECADAMNADLQEVSFDDHIEMCWDADY